MKQRKKIRYGMAALLLILGLTLSACSHGQSESSPMESSPPASAGQEETTQPETDQPDTAANEAILYIGIRDGGFTEYPMTYEGSLTPEVLIAGIGDLTGWDMTLATTAPGESAAANRSPKASVSASLWEIYSTKQRSFPVTFPNSIQYTIF